LTEILPGHGALGIEAPGGVFTWCGEATAYRCGSAARQRSEADANGLEFGIRHLDLKADH
jgi:hypothetical protein